MKTYKVWMELEEYDTETDECRSLTGEVEPVPVGVFEDKDEAVEWMENHDCVEGC